MVVLEMVDFVAPGIEAEVVVRMIERQGHHD